MILHTKYKGWYDNNFNVYAGRQQIFFAGTMLVGVPALRATYWALGDGDEAAIAALLGAALCPLFLCPMVYWECKRLRRGECKVGCYYAWRVLLLYAVAAAWFAALVAWCIGECGDHGFCAGVSCECADDGWPGARCGRFERSDLCNDPCAPLNLNCGAGSQMTGQLCLL